MEVLLLYCQSVATIAPVDGRSRGNVVELLEINQGTVQQICKTYQVKYLDVFGSAVAPDFDPEKSDLDFVVEFLPGKIKDAADRYFGLLFALEDLFGCKVDLLMEAAISNPYLKKSINETRVRVYAS